MAISQNDFLSGVVANTATTAFEPIRTNNAVLRITGLNTLLGLSSAESAVTLSLAGFSLPKNETSPVMVPYLNEVRKFAGQTVFDDMSVSFHDYVDRAIAQAMWAWRYKIHDPRTGLRGIKTTYAANAEIEHFAPDGGLSRFYTVQGIWPMSLDMGDIEMGADEPVRIQVRFCCDKVYPKDGSGFELGDGVTFQQSGA
jgi:hypothetical protein